AHTRHRALRVAVGEIWTSCLGGKSPGLRHPRSARGRAARFVVRRRGSARPRERNMKKRVGPSAVGATKRSGERKPEVAKKIRRFVEGGSLKSARWPEPSAQARSEGRCDTHTGNKRISEPRGCPRRLLSFCCSRLADLANPGSKLPTKPTSA